MADADDSDLRARVEQLEATVEAQQATIEQLLPSRRRVLQAGGLVAGGGVLGALSADRASAQASGQVGTSSDPVDVEAYDLAVQNELSSSVDAGGNDLTNVGSLKTGDATVTNSPATADDVLRFQEGAEVGEVLIDGLDNSGADDGWGSSTATNANVSFDSAFNNTPYIQLTIDTNTSQVNGDEWLCTINNPTTTGFDVTVFQMAANDNSGITDAYAVEYQATEGR